MNLLVNRAATRWFVVSALFLGARAIRAQTAPLIPDPTADSVRFVQRNFASVVSLDTAVARLQSSDHLHALRDTTL